MGKQTVYVVERTWSVYYAGAWSHDSEVLGGFSTPDLALEFIRKGPADYRDAFRAQSTTVWDIEIDALVA